MKHTSETRLAVRVHSGHKGFNVRMNNSDGSKINAAISFPSLHKIHHGMKQVQASEITIFESKSEYGTVTVKQEGDLFHVHARPYNPKTPEVDALVSMKAVEVMVALANDFVHGKLSPDETFEIRVEALSASETAVA